MASSKGKKPLASGPYNCRGWLIYMRHCRGLSLAKIADLSGGSVFLIQKRMKALSVPLGKERGATRIFSGVRKKSGIIEPAGPGRTFTPTERLAIEISLRQAKRKGYSRDKTVYMIATEHDRPVDFVLEKIAEIEKKGGL